ncbi:MAG: hypothetical protein M3P08_03545 [Thermoproteota archaeon]|nr:hypothetical protein [Thermoproteota archaeon]
MSVVGSVILEMFFEYSTAKATLLVEAIGRAIKAAAIITETAIVVVVEIAPKAVFFIDRPI